MTVLPVPPASAHPLNEALGHAASDKRLDVLRRVGKTGSISQAARDVGISYKAAWQAVETLSNLSGLVLVDRAVGGAGGGGASLTPEGARLLALADELACARAAVLARFEQGLVGLAGAGADVGQSSGPTLGRALGPALGRAGLGLRTSMRNQLPCQVVSVATVGQGPMVRVGLVTAGGDELASLLTRDSADLLGLSPGLAVLALCKATAVAVSATTAEAVSAYAPAASPGACVLRGTVADVSGGQEEQPATPGVAGEQVPQAMGTHEVGLTLAGGQLWVGFAAQGHRLVTGDVACAVFTPSSVVIGLEG